MNAVMATVATYSLYSREKLEELYYGPHHPRCTHISVGVIRTFSMVIMLMAACGYPVPLSGDRCIEIFNQMRRAISRAARKSSRRPNDRGTQSRGENPAANVAGVKASS
ncbi:hypothetical protein U1Q18_045916 [Sarracenia purpurea var. burkii]